MKVRKGVSIFKVWPEKQGYNFLAVYFAWQKKFDPFVDQTYKKETGVLKSYGF